MGTVEIICSNCGAEAFLNREPVYEGLAKTGERLRCSACGYEYPSEATVPFKARPKTPKVFSDADRSAKVDVFDEGENRRLCRYCANYIVNPFTQYCSLHKKEVQATDTCGQFKAAENTSKKPPPL